MHSGTERQRRKLNFGFEQLEPRLVMTGVVINEFLASNTSGIRDQDGDRSDWIELRNTDAVAVNLAGWHLTDDAQDLDKWTLPAVNLAAGAYLTIFASGKDRSALGQELHTNFQLSTAGEYLALVMPDGVNVADSFAPYPAQLDDVSYGPGVSTESLVGEHAGVSVFAPTNSTLGTTWTAASFNDTSWTHGATGVGYERTPGGVVDFTSYFSLNVNSMFSTSSSGSGTMYIRIPFSVTNVATLQSLTLNMRYDDGFVAYLNGQVVASRNAPASLAFNSVASTSHGDDAAIVYETISISQHLNKLVEGDNVLAIQGLNVMNTTANRSDFLISPTLTAVRPGLVGFMVAPTPDAANAEATLGLVADTHFSVDRGFFASPFPVEITTATEGAQIRYTVDGSPPTATTGLVYDSASPPMVTKTTTLRAAAFKSGFTPTNVDTQTYIFLDNVIHQTGAGLPPYTPWGLSVTSPVPDWDMDPDVVNNPLYASTIKNDLKSIPTVSLVAPWSSWFGGQNVGIYPISSELEVATSMEYFNANGSQSFQIDGGIEIQGGTSDDRWKTDKLSMRIKFKEPYGPTKFDADIFTNPYDDEAAATSFDTLILDAQINYTWPYGGSSNPTDQRARAMYVQDQVVADLQNQAGGKAPHGRFVQLYINGLYWGMYDLHERPDDSFAAEYFGGDKDDYDVLKHDQFTVVSGDSTAVANYAAMLNLARQNLSVPANYAAVAAKVDLDDLVNYMLINYYVGNDDWPHHNWYASFNRVDPSGKWRYHSWDSEHVFKNVSYNAIQNGGVDSGSPEEVHSLLMANEEYRLKFSDAAQKLLANGGLLTPEKMAAVYTARTAEVDRAIVGESARWGDSRTTSAEPPGAGKPYTREMWVSTQTGLINNYFPVRTNIVRQQLASKDWLVPLGAPTLNNYGGTVSSNFQLTLAKPAGSPAGGLLYYTLDGSDPRLAGGGLSPTAIAYAGPITIAASAQVHTRVFDLSQAGTRNDWSAEIAATFLLDTPFPLRITELNYNPAEFNGQADAQNLEFIELMNTGAQPISLDDVQITQFSGSGYKFAEGLTLDAGERIVVAKNPEAFQAAYGAGVRLAPTGYGDDNLSNGGERVALLGPLGETLQDFVYDDVDAWATAADGNGKSLEIINPLGDATSAANWRASYYAGGSPGAEGLAPLMAADFDGNSVVDGNDFIAWQRGLGTPAFQGWTETGDADGDRDVDAADLTMWASSFDDGIQPPAAAAILAENEWILAEPVRVKPVGVHPLRERALDGVMTQYRWRAASEGPLIAEAKFGRGRIHAARGTAETDLALGDCGDSPLDSELPHLGDGLRPVA